MVVEGWFVNIYLECPWGISSTAFTFTSSFYTAAVTGAVIAIVVWLELGGGGCRGWGLGIKPSSELRENAEAGGVVKGVARGTVELRLAWGKAAMVGDIGNVLDDAGPGFMVGRVRRGGAHVDVENRDLRIIDGDFQRAGFDRVENFVNDVRDRVVVVEEVVMLSNEATDLPRDLEVVLYDLRNDNLILVVSSKGQAS